MIIYQYNNIKYVIVVCFYFGLGIKPSILCQKPKGKVNYCVWK